LGDEFIQVLVGKPDGKRPLGRHRRRCEDNIKVDVKETVVLIGLISLKIGTSGRLF
jgi:hypothetical protein